jgi:CSLREA domain-containing protein
LAALATLCAPAAASGATVTVNGTGDSAANDGTCTLREAITAANSNTQSGAAAGECPAGDALPQVDTIDFSITGGGPHVITPATELPELREQMTIDGGLTDPNRVVLDGVDGTKSGLTVALDEGFVVRRLAIIRFGEGIDVSSTSNGNTFESNRIGTNFGNDAGLGNTGAGIDLSSDGNAVTGNVISGNGSGIEIFTGEDNVISDNRIGMDVDGETALGNAGAGVSVFAADGNLVGGAGGADANVISGNGTGVSLTVSTNNRVQGNLIGTNLDGDTALPNEVNGVIVSGLNATGNLVGGAAPGEGNVISGNGELGVSVLAAGTTVDGNLIGTDADGLAAIPNREAGVDVGASDTTVGGAAGNVISGNDTLFTTPGVLVDSSSALTGVVIEGNRIGTTADGLAAVPNTTGIRASGSSEGLRITDNLISGNDRDGIVLDAPFITTVLADTVIQGNQVGNAIDGSTLGNGHAGLRVADAEGTLVGGTALGETNTFNSSGLAGVALEADAVETALLGNHINVNGDLGINLVGGVEDAFGVTANDALDADSGANGLQNFPVLETVVAGSTTAASGRLESLPDTDYLIEFLTSPAGDPSGHGEGVQPLGTTEVSTDGQGLARFAVSGLDGTDPGDPITATATELTAAGDPRATSEFAANLAAQACDITGTSADDPALSGTSADEIICGLEGDDTIDPGGGDDVIVGGSGVDELDLSGAAAAADVDLAQGTASAGGDELTALDVEDVTGTDFADTLVGGDGGNVLVGGDAADDLEGADGNDTLKGEDNADDLNGGEGTDTLKGHRGEDALEGKDGTDELIGGDGADDMEGDGGNRDDLEGGGARDTLNGGGGSNDVCDGGGKQDHTPAPGCETKRSIP